MFNFFNKKKESNSQKVLTKNSENANSLAELKSTSHLEIKNKSQDLLRRMILNEKQSDIKNSVKKIPDPINITGTHKLPKVTNPLTNVEKLNVPPPPPPANKPSISETGEYKVKPSLPSFMTRTGEYRLPPKPPPPDFMTKTGEYKLPKPLIKNENNSKIKDQNIISDSPDLSKVNEKNAIFENGTIFGITIDKTSKKEILNIMNNISNFKIENNSSLQLNYEDLGITFSFSSNDCLKEITINEPFDGKTTKGLKINHSINKAIEIYGQPRIRTASGAMWNTLSVFLRDDIIKTIRLGNI